MESGMIPLMTTMIVSWPKKCKRLENLWHFLLFLQIKRYGGFDRLAARAVIEAKKTHLEMTLTLLLPYHPAERPMTAPECSNYPPGMERVPRCVAIVRANQYMVERVDYLIACARHPGSNARELVEYACILVL